MLMKFKRIIRELLPELVIQKYRTFQVRRNLPERARKAERQDFVGVPAFDPGPEVAILASLSWIGRAQDCSVTADGGVSRHFSLVNGWGPSYPETTGYIVPTMLAEAKIQDDAALRRRAESMLDWLVAIQLPAAAQVSILCPTELQLDLCQPDEVCYLAPIMGEIDSVKVKPSGTYSAETGEVCLLVETSGYHFVDLIAYGGGFSDSCRTTLIVSIAEPLGILLPQDTSVYLCEPDILCFAISVTGQAADSITVNYGTYEPVMEAVCFETDTSGSYNIVVTAYSMCGSTSGSFTVNVYMIQPPMVSCPGSVDTTVCQTQELCIPVSIVGDVSSVVVNGGTYADGYVCMTPESSGAYNLVVTATGPCGSFDACGISVQANVTGACFSRIDADSAEVSEVVTADLDLDTYADVIFGGESNAGLYVAWGQHGDLPIGAADSVAAISNADVRVFHLNSDTLPDIVAVTNSWIYVLLNNGDRTFSADSCANSTTPVKQSSPSAGSYGGFPQLAVGFLDTDPYPDLVVTPDRWFRGDGAGGFLGNPALGVTLESVDIADMDGDGIDDIVVIESDSVVVYANDGTVSFSKLGAEYLGLETYGLSSITSSVDINNDGFVDAVAVIAQNVGETDSSVVTILAGDGDGGLVLSDVIVVEGVAPQVSLSDVNRDFRLDVIVSNSTAGELVVFYNDGTGQFIDPDTAVIGGADELRFALASADMDRDGQPDFLSGSAAGDNLVIELNDQPDEPVLDDELFVTGYDYIDVSLTNPGGFVVSRSLRTVAGSDYYRLRVDNDDLLDARAYDYNLQYGTYTLTGTPRPGSVEEPWSMGIGIDGSQQVTVAYNYVLPIGKKFAAAEVGGGFVFPYEVEASPSMKPWNGLPTDQALPVFQWKLRTASDPLGTKYAFQIDDYHDFSSVPLREEEFGLTEAEYKLKAALPRDNVYYWRYLTSHDDGATYPETSLTFAVYVTDCCLGRVGDANGSGSDLPTIGDVAALISHKFITEEPLQCYGEADINRSGGLYPGPGDITIGDISLLIDYLFVTGPETFGPLPDCM